MVDPKDGGAWYPSYDECRARVDIDANIAPHEQLVRNAIDLHKERGGQVGGEVVGWQFLSEHGHWTYCSEGDAAMYRLRGGIEVRELIARLPACTPDPVTTEKWESGELGRSMEHAEVAKPARGQVVAEPVAWRLTHIPDLAWERYTTHYGRGAHDSFKESGCEIQYAYSRPATVPAEVMEAATRLSNWSAGRPVIVDADTIFNFLKAIQGAGHGQG